MPRSLRIGHMRYAITRTVKPWMRRDITDGGKGPACPNDPGNDQTILTRGVCWPTNGLIYVEARLRPHAAREVLLHEALHACWVASNLHRTSAAPREEQVVGSLAPILLEVLRNNPALVRYLTEKGTP